MPDYHPLATPLLVVDAGALTIPVEVEISVANLWAAAKVEAPDMFDGPVLSVRRWEGAVLTVEHVRYRHVVAAWRDQKLAELLQIRPLAVTGILSCPQGVVFGQRGSGVAEARCTWELVPSGGAVDIDLRRQIATEAAEEIGLAGDEISIGEPLALIVTSQLIDVLFPMATYLSANDIIERHRQRGSREYDRLLVSTSLDEFVRSHSDLVAASRAIIDHLIAKSH